MRLIEKFTARRALPEQTFAGSGWGPGAVLSQSYTAGDTESILPTFASYVGEGYQGNGIVFSVILARLNLFAEAEFRFRDARTKRLFGSDALAILENPWPGGTTGELLARMEQDVSLAGNAFIRRDGDRLIRLRPDWVDIMHKDCEVLGYVYWEDGRGHNEPEFFPVEDVAHWSPIPDPVSTYRGMSWLTPVVREINADLSMTEYKREFFNNAATPNMLIKYEQTLAPGAVEQMQARWQARHGGPDGWKTAILDQGADLQIIGNTMEQMRFADVQAAGENRIAAAGGVPSIIVGLKEGLQAATYSNYSTAMRRFADGTMRPNWRSACAALSKVVEIPPGARLWYDTSDISALREGEKERAETMSVLSAAASTLLTAGYTADSITSALTANDMTLLEHTGLISVQLLPNTADAAQAAIAAPTQGADK